MASVLMRRSWGMILWAAVALLCPPVALRADEGTVGTSAVLAPGDTPLTESMAARVQRFFEWSLGVQFTQEECAALRMSLVDNWRTGDKDGIQGVLSILTYDQQVSALSDEERAEQREATEAVVLEQLRAEPEDRSGKWLLDVYDAAHRPIAEGDPPLTRQAADSYLEMLSFIMGEAAGQSGLRMDEATRESFAAGLTADYPEYPVERQAQIARAPLEWASLRAGWAKADEEERATARKQWAADLKPQDGAPPQQPEAEVQSPEREAMALLQAALEDLKAERVREAVEKIQAAIETAPKLGTGYYLRGELWRVAEENDAALADLGKAIDLDPGMVEAYDSRARVCEAMNRPQEAEADRGRAESLRKVQQQPPRPEGETSPEGYDAAAAKLQAQQRNFMAMSNILRMQQQNMILLAGNRMGGPTYRYP